jgi:hypothetical protein
MERLRLLNRNLLFYALVFLSSSIKLYGQSSVGCDSLGTILRSFKDFRFNELKPESEVFFREFSFRKMEGFGKPLKNHYYIVGRDNSGNIITLEYYDNRAVQIRYKLYFYRSGNLVLIAPKIYDGVQFMNLHCILVRFYKNDKVYVINYGSQFSDHPSGKSISDGLFSFDNFSELSSVMILDSEFVPQYMFRLEDSIIEFTSDFFLVEGEICEKVTLYPKAVTVKITNSTCLDEVKSNAPLITFTPFTVKPLKGKGFERAPLWLWAAAHNYE